MKELWLPTSTTHATVTTDGDVQVWDTIEFEKRKTKTPIAPNARAADSGEGLRPLETEQT